MRTKVLLCAAAMAASLASSMAQNVYSLNVVGYVNVTLPAHQFSIVANPLDATLGGTVAGGNDLTNLFSATTMTGLAGGSTISTFVPSLNDYSAPITYSALSKKWGSTIPMPPGVGVLFLNNGAADAVVTFTGQVEQGTYNVASMASHTFNMVGSPVPIGGDVTNSTTVVGLAPGGGDTVSTFNSTANDFSAPSTWSALSKKWSPTTTIAPGQGFLYLNNAATANNWVSNFTVQ
jgi:archaellum component FlaG (FlaF/FlaG flagellin family)